jgi:hypothetical protein
MRHFQSSARHAHESFEILIDTVGPKPENMPLILAAFCDIIDN